MNRPDTERYAVELVVQLGPCDRGARHHHRRDEPMTEPTEAEMIEALAGELREAEIARQLAAGGPGTVASSDTPRTIARDVIRSDWLAEVKAAARAEGERDAGRMLAALVFHAGGSVTIPPNLLTEDFTLARRDDPVYGVVLNARLDDPA